MAAPQRPTQQEALQARAREIIETALADDELMAQTLDGLDELAQGKRGVPLRELQEQERARTGTGR